MDVGLEFSSDDSFLDEDSLDDEVKDGSKGNK